MSIGLIIGGGAGSMFIPVNSSPDGVLTMPRGTLAIDTTTGVTWRNEDGTTRWYPALIPPRMGEEFLCDFNGSIESPLSSFVIGGGTSPLMPVDMNAIGIAQSTVTAVADRASIRSVSVQNWLLFGLGAVYGGWRVRSSNAEDGTDNFSGRFGFGDSDSPDFTDGAYFEANRNVFGDNNWRICTASNGVRTKVATTTAPSAAAYQRLRVRINATATAADFWIGDVYQGQITTNIPSGVGRDTGLESQVIKTLGVNARSFNIDYCEMAIVLSTSR